MQYSFRLAELLAHVPDPRKRPGTIKAIVEYTGLDRHQVAALLKNEVKYIPLKALSRLCDYLIEYGHATADELPGALFAIEPESFWELMARRKRLEFALGVRRDFDADNPEVAYVVASDSVLLGELLNGVTTLGGTAKLRKPGSADSATLAVPATPRPEHLKQSLIWSPGQASEEEVHKRANAVYDDFSECKMDKAIVAIGSTKSNPVVEIILARAFGCEPFVSQDNVESASQRSVPFYIRYRDNDPHPASCAGGVQLSRKEASKEPGIYFPLGNGKWDCVSTLEKKQECAFLAYFHRESQGRLEMVMGGFSGRATRLLARSLASTSQDFWPPAYNDQGLQAGAYILKFEVDTSDKKTQLDILSTDFSATTTVIPVPLESMKATLDR